MPGRQDRAAKIVSELAKNRAEPLFVAEVRPQQHALEKPESFGERARQRLQANVEVATNVGFLVRAGAGIKLQREPAGVGRELTGQILVAHVREPAVGSRGGVEHEVVGEVIGNGIEVEGDVHVRDAVGKQPVHEKRYPLGRLGALHGNDLDLPRQVVDGEEGNLRDVLGRIRLALQGQQSLLGLAHRLSLGLGHALGRTGELRLLRLAASSRLIGVGDDDEGAPVPVLEEVLLDELLEKARAGVDRPAQLFEPPGELQRLLRSFAVQPAAKRLSHESEPERPALDLPVSKLHRPKGCGHQLRVDTLAGKAAQLAENELFDLIGPLRLGPAHTDRESHLEQLRLDTRGSGEVFAERGLRNGTVQRGARVPEEDLGEDFDRERLKGIGHRRKQPVEGDRGPRFRVLGVDGIGAREAHGLAAARLEGDYHLRGRGGGGAACRPAFRTACRPAFRRRAGKRRKKLVLDEREVALALDVAVEEDAGVARVIVPAVKIAKLFIGEVRDLRRISAGIVAVGRVRQQRAHRPLARNGVVGGVVPLHLVVDDAGALEVALIVELQPMPLLGEHLRLQQRKEHRIAVDLHDVEEVGLDRAARGVHGLIGKGHRVEEGVHAPAHEHEEGILQRIPPGAAEHGVLENMRNTGRIGRRRFEDEGEEVFRVVIVHMVHLAAGCLMAKEPPFGAVLRKRRCGDRPEAVCSGVTHRSCRSVIVGLSRRLV